MVEGAFPPLCPALFALCAQRKNAAGTLGFPSFDEHHQVRIRAHAKDPAGGGCTSHILPPTFHARSKFLEIYGKREEIFGKRK